jgi:arsenite methyltransferase
VLDLGSGSGTDTFYAALQVGPSGQVIGRDMTPAQVEKATRLAGQGGFPHVQFSQGRIEDLPFDDATQTWAVKSISLVARRP